MFYIALKSVSALELNFCLMLVEFIVQHPTLLCLIQGCEDADHLHYAALSHNKVGRSRGQRDTTSESVYSGVRP